MKLDISKLLLIATLFIFGISNTAYASTKNSTESNQQSKEDKTKKIDTTNSTKPFNPSKSFELLKPQLNLPSDEVGLFGWEGTYGFSEIVPVNSTSNLIRNYEIRIYKQDSGYAADIILSGSQTPSRISAQVKATSSDSIGLYFSSYRDGNQGTYQPGNLLLQLQKLPQDRFKVVFAGVSSLSQNRAEFVPENMVSTKMIRGY
jgi:Family of unknown function (DUF5991)